MKRSRVTIAVAVCIIAMVGCARARPLPHSQPQPPEEQPGSTECDGNQNCLWAAYEAGQPAYLRAVIGAGEDTTEWYVRPEGGSRPIRLDAQAVHWPKDVYLIDCTKMTKSGETYYLVGCKDEHGHAFNKKIKIGGEVP